MIITRLVVRYQSERKIERTDTMEDSADFGPTNGSEMAAQAMKKRAPGCGLWIAWILVSVGGASLGWAAGWQLTFWLPGELASAVLGLPVGLLIGAAQWLLLRRWIPAAGWWIPASMVGWSVGFYLGVELALLGRLAEFGFGLAVGAVIGVLGGAFQWLVLRRHFHGAGWWIAASLAGWVAALVIYRPGFNLAGGLYGIAFGVITGPALMAIIRKPRG